MPGADIGRSCNIGQNVFVASHVKVGDNNKIQNNVSLYEGLESEEDVFIGPSAVFTNVVNPRSHVSRRDDYRKTILKKGATIGANATVVCGVTIGRYAFVGAGAVITKDVADYALMVGVPARQDGWMSAYGERLNFDSLGLAQCKGSGEKYRLLDGQCRPVNT
jgi:UDP-2-acetamido-3-amino-2,3-dideoxy-glucuronate N-acetyltransferase